MLRRDSSWFQIDVWRQRSALLWPKLSSASLSKAANLQESQFFNFLVQIRDCSIFILLKIRSLCVYGPPAGVAFNDGRHQPISDAVHY